MAACYRRIWLALVLCALPSAFAAETAALEYNVKAAYLPLFARYVAWPQQTFSDAKSPVVIAVVGRDPFGDVLDETVRGQLVNGRSIEIVRVAQPTTDLRAHIVFIARRQLSDERQWIAMWRNRPLLVVGESEDTLTAGGVVRLLEDHQRIRFDVDWRNAQRANLKISSPMLLAARNVYGAPPQSNWPEPQ